MIETIPRMSCIDSIINGFKKSFNCQGRTRRSEFWTFILSTWGFFFLCEISSAHFFFGESNSDKTDQTDQNKGNKKEDDSFFDIYITIIMVFFIILFISSTSLTIRRLHDTGKSCGYYWLIFIPYVGLFILIIFCLKDSEKNENEYGPSPKYRRKEYSDV